MFLVPYSARSHSTPLLRLPIMSIIRFLISTTSHTTKNPISDPYRPSLQNNGANSRGETRVEAGNGSNSVAPIRPRPRLRKKIINRP